MKSIRIYLFLVLFCIFSPSLFANQDSNLVIHEKDWKEAIEGIDYTETYKDQEVEEEKKTDPINYTPLNYNWSFLKYVFYIAVIGLVLFLIFKILTNLNKNPNIKKQDISIESIAEIEEKIHEIDLDGLLKEALDSKMFHIALRINFLIIIKLLSENGSINWAKEKTNWEYYSEIKDVVLKDGFKEIVVVFEPVWYGEHHLTEEGFYQLQPSFDNYKKQFDNHE